MNHYLQQLDSVFKQYADSEIAVHQKAYMRDQFDFFGLQSPVRKEVQKPFLRKENLPPREELADTVKELWNLPQREFHYFAMELTNKYTRQFTEEDIHLLEWMVTHKSWWDTVDYLAAHPVGDYFKQFPHTRDVLVESWLSSGNIWLQRSSLLFQLFYKNNLDTGFLVYVINSLLGSNEFFINKAIGWILRQYSKTNPQWVAGFVNTTTLHPLSVREAMKIIRKNG